MNDWGVANDATQALSQAGRGALAQAKRTPLLRGAREAASIGHSLVASALVASHVNINWRWKERTRVARTFSKKVVACAYWRP